MLEYTILPHEFLYLLAHTSDRVKQITMNHRVSFKSEKHPVRQWELQEAAETEAPTSNLHLLAKDAFVNKAPHHLITNALSKQQVELQNQPLKYVGQEWNVNPDSDQAVCYLKKTEDLITMYETQWNLPDPTPQDPVLKLRSLNGEALQHKLDT